MATQHIPEAMSDNLAAAYPDESNVHARVRMWRDANSLSEWEDYVAHMRTANGDVGTVSVADTELTFWASGSAPV